MWILEEQYQGQTEWATLSPLGDDPTFSLLKHLEHWDLVEVGPSWITFSNEFWENHHAPGRFDWSLRRFRSTS